MKKINRFIAWTIIILVAISILVGIVAIAGSWAINERITNDILNILSGVQSGLDVLVNTLERLDGTLSAARDLVQTVQSTANQLGEGIEEGSPLLALLTRTVNEDLVSKINAARETVIAIRDAVVAFNSTLETLNALPFIEVPTITDQLQGASDRLADLALLVQELRNLVADVQTGIVDTLVTPIVQITTRIDNELTSIQTAVQSFIEEVNTVSAMIADLQAKVPTWIDIITISLSIVILWFILAQIAMLAVARGYLRTGYLPWNYPTEKEPVVLTEPAENEAAKDSGLESEPSETDEDQLAR
jgi:archaellum component FlaC